MPVRLLRFTLHLTSLRLREQEVFCDEVNVRVLVTDPLVGEVAIHALVDTPLVVRCWVVHGVCDLHPAVRVLIEGASSIKNNKMVCMLATDLAPTNKNKVEVCIGNNLLCYVQRRLICHSMSSGLEQLN